MPISERAARLRQQSLDAVSSLSSERAELLTRFCQENQKVISAPVRRALAFQYLMEHKTICINEGELIVGEKGPAPKAAPTYPELCCHTPEDLDILNGREKVDRVSQCKAETSQPNRDPKPLPACWEIQSSEKDPQRAQQNQSYHLASIPRGDTSSLEQNQYTGND